MNTLSRGAHAPSRVSVGASPTELLSDRNTYGRQPQGQACGEAPQAAREARALPWTRGSCALAALILATVCQVLCNAAAQAAEGRLPNVVLIVVDDLGWADLGCYGSTFHETPNIDRLAREGVRFTQAYSACTVCSPTRASILTGKYPARLHITDWIPGHKRPEAKLRVPAWTQHLPTDEWNLAKALKSAGYATVSIGKWHLGGSGFYPEKQGFDANIGGTDRGQPPSYVSPYKIPTLTDGPPGEFLTDREAAEACRFIEANRERPFFIYLPHYAVHQPIAGKPEVVAKYRAKADPQAPQHNATYAALLESVDDALGRIRAKLDELKLSDRTIIVFTSDNGGLILGGKNAPTSNAPLRSGKGSPYEGGVRVPLIVHWPGRGKAGIACEIPAMSIDLYPTILEMTGARNPADHKPDGRSLVPLLSSASVLGRDALHWHYPHYHPGGATPYGAIRRGDFKLIEFFENGRLELFDLKSDPSEQQDMAAAHPETAQRLQNQLAAWRKEVGAQMPAPNPN
ncbi:MAG: sulfatase [Verrucomicrobia bacterium]|nr:sulfatase [Verrucomicrobiota bacterium]